MLRRGDTLGTDSGPPCKICKCSICLYTVEDDSYGFDVRVKCMTCHRETWLGFSGPADNVHDVAEAHARQIDSFPQHHPA